MTTEAVPTNRLQELREAAGMSRAGLADYMGVGEFQVRRWELEEALIPTKHLERLTAKFSVSVEHLMGWDREPATTGKAA